jgi:hypothetical protein
VGLGRDDDPPGNPGPAASRTGDPGARSEHEEGPRDIVKSAWSAFSRALRPVIRSSAQAERSGVSRRVTGRGSLASAAVTHWSGRRNRHRSMPASSGAQAPTRARGTMARRVCPRVEYGCRSRRTTPRPREVRSAGKGAHGRGPNPSRDRKVGVRAQRASRADRRGSKATTLAKARAGRPKGRCGARVFVRWKAPLVVLSAHHVHAGGLGMASAALDRALGARAPGVLEGEATGVSEARSARTATGRKRPPR